MRRIPQRQFFRCDEIGNGLVRGHVAVQPLDGAVRQGHRVEPVPRKVVRGTDQHNREEIKVPVGKSNSPTRLQGAERQPQSRHGKQSCRCHKRPGRQARVMTCLGKAAIDNQTRRQRHEDAAGIAKSLGTDATQQRLPKTEQQQPTIKLAVASQMPPGDINPSAEPSHHTAQHNRGKRQRAVGGRVLVRVD